MEYCSTYLPTIYSSVCTVGYFGSSPSFKHEGKHDIWAPPLGLQKKAIDCLAGVMGPLDAGGATTRCSVLGRN